MARQNGYIDTPRICDYVTLHVQRDSADVIESLRWGDYPGLFRWTESYHTCPLSRDRLLVVVRKGDVTMEHGQRPETLLAFMEEGGQELRNKGGLLNSEKLRKSIFLYRLQREI